MLLRSHFIIISTSSYLATTKHCHVLYKLLMKQTPNQPLLPFTLPPLVQPAIISPLDSCIGLLFVFAASMFALCHSGPLQRARRSLQNGHHITPSHGLNPSKGFPLQLVGNEKLPSSGWWISNDLALLTSLAHLTSLYSLFQTFTSASLMSQHSTLGMWLLTFSYHSSLNSNANSFRKDFSGYSHGTLSPPITQ